MNPPDPNISVLGLKKIVASGSMPWVRYTTTETPFRSVNMQHDPQQAIKGFAYATDLAITRQFDVGQWICNLQLLLRVMKGMDSYRKEVPGSSFVYATVQHCSVSFVYCLPLAITYHRALCSCNRETKILSSTNVFIHDPKSCACDLTVIQGSAFFQHNQYF